MASCHSLRLVAFGKSPDTSYQPYSPTLKFAELPGQT
jgi:hypothetical protein